MKIPPPGLLIQVSNDPSAENYENVGPVRWAVEQSLIAAGYRFSDFDRILDFGCGVGRLLQALQQVRREGQQLFGCDVNAACAAWCRENLDFASVEHTALEPPLPYADQSFDLVTAISVFTHLSRPLQVAWARELMRVLRPGGVALVTTVGLGLLPDVLKINERWAVREYALLGATGNFFHFAEAPASALEGQREVVAVHSNDAIAQIFSPMRIVRHIGISPIAAGQDASIIVKPKSGCRVIAAGGASRDASTAGEVPANGTTSNVVTLRFESDYAGPAHFRAYVAMAERRYDLVASRRGMSDGGHPHGPALGLAATRISNGGGARPRPLHSLHRRVRKRSERRGVSGACPAQNAMAAGANSISLVGCPHRGRQRSA